MPRRKDNVVRVDGPFLGLDVSVDPRQIRPNQCQSCLNVHFAHGAIERRPGTRFFGVGSPIEHPTTGDPMEVLSLHYHSAHGVVQGEFALAVCGTVDEPTFNHFLFQLQFATEGNAIGPWTEVKQLFQTFPGRSIPTITQISDGVSMVLTGTEPPLGVDSDSFKPLDGFPAIPDKPALSPLEWVNNQPTQEGVYFEPIENTPALAELGVRYKYSVSNPDGEWPLLYESNASPGNETEGPFGGGGAVIQLGIPLELTGDLQNTYHIPVDMVSLSSHVDFGNPGDGPATHVTVYRARVHAFGPLQGLEVTPYYKVETVAAADLEVRAQGTVHRYLDKTPDEKLDTSKVAPTRNLQPPNALFAAEFFNRMFYAGSAQLEGTPISPERYAGHDLLWYSSENEWFHVGEANWVQVGHDGAPITGLVNYFGQLLILKDKEIWRLSGALTSGTNETDAAGQTEPAQYAELTRVETGAGNTNILGATGVVEVDGVLFFAGRDGFYAYNGQAADVISDSIGPYLRNRVGRSVNQVSASVDRENQLVLWCVQDPTKDEFQLITGTGPGASYGEGPETDPPAPADSTALSPSSLIYACHYSDYTKPGASDTGEPRWSVYDVPLARCVGDLRRATHKTTDYGVIVGRTDGLAVTLGGHPGRGVDVGSTGTDTEIPWHWRGPDFEMGTPERRKRWHYLSTSFERQPNSAFWSRYYLDDNQTSGEDIPEGDTEIAANISGDHKQRIFRRAKKLSVEFLSGVPGGGSTGPVRITGYQLDVTPLDSR